MNLPPIVSLSKPWRAEQNRPLPANWAGGEGRNVVLMQGVAAPGAVARSVVRGSFGLTKATEQHQNSGQDHDARQQTQADAQTQQ